MGCGDVMITIIFMAVATIDAMLWETKSLSLCEVLYNELIDAVCFWVIFVVPTAAVNRHGRTRVIFHVYAIYTYNMATATLNIDNT